MSQLDSLLVSHTDGAMDLVEQTVSGAGWACERTEEGLIHCASMTKWGEFGGSFIYPMGEDMVTVGMVVGLDYRDYVKIDPRYFRPTEVETLLGDPSKAKAKLGWTPEITVQQMCAEMVATDLEEAKKHALLKTHGYAQSVSIE